MKKLLLVLTTISLSAGVAAQMGKRYPSERQTFVDPGSGLLITALTSPEKNDRFPYQTDPMWTADRKHIIFRSSSRTGQAPTETTLPNGEKRMIGPRTQYYFIEESTGEIIQATEGNDTGGAYLAHTSNKLFYTRNADDVTAMYELNLDSLFKHSKEGNIQERSYYERKVGEWDSAFGKFGGFAIDCTDEYAYISVSREPTKQELKAAENKPQFQTKDIQPIKVKPAWGGIRKMDLRTGEISSIVDTDFRVGHIQTVCSHPERLYIVGKQVGMPSSACGFVQPTER